jgi:hypothetical protein
VDSRKPLPAAHHSGPAAAVASKPARCLLLHPSLHPSEAVAEKAVVAVASAAGLADIAHVVIIFQFIRATRVRNDGGLTDIACHVIGMPFITRHKGSKMSWRATSAGPCRHHHPRHRRRGSYRQSRSRAAHRRRPRPHRPQPPSGPHLQSPSCKARCHSLADCLLILHKHAVTGT